MQKCLFEFFLFTVDWHNCDLWCRIHAKSCFEVLSDTQNQKNFWNSGQNHIWSSQLQEKNSDNSFLLLFCELFSLVKFGIKELFHKRNLHCVFFTPYVNYFQHISALQKALKWNCNCSLSLQCPIKWHLFDLVCYCFMWWQWVVFHYVTLIHF